MRTLLKSVVPGLWLILIVAAAPVILAADQGAKVSVDFKRASIQEVANFLSVKAGVNVVVEKGVVGEVNLKLNSVTWMDALTLAAQQVGCAVEKGADDIYRVVTPHFTFTTKSEGVSLKQVISLLAQQSGQNIVVAPNVDAVVNFSLQDVPWQVALDTIVKTSGPFTVVRDEAGVYRVVKSDSLAEQKETRVFQLKYIQPPSEYKPKLTSQFAEKASGSTTSTAKDLKDSFTLYKAIDEVVDQRGSVAYDFDSNSFIVTSTRPILDQVTEIIRLVDVQPNQVFIDVKFVTTTHTDLLNAGVKLAKGLMIAGSGGKMVTRLPFELGKDGWQADLSPVHSGVTPADVDAALGSGGIYTFGVIDFTNVAPVLEFLKNDSNSEILQAPSLTVVDNKTATVFVGEQIHFAEEFSVTNQGGQLSRGIREASQNSPVKVGTQLMVMPHIVPDTDRVILSVIPTSDQLTGSTSPTVSGFERFTVGESFIDLPRLSSRTVVTTMMLQDGQTAVIGGLINQSRSINKTQLPFLGDIPIIGWLFKNKETNNSINNLYIFISIRVLHDNADMKTLFAEYDVPAATAKPYKHGAPIEPVIKEKGKKGAQPAASVEQAPTEADVVGSGWEESEKGVEKFDVKK